MAASLTAADPVATTAPSRRRSRHRRGAMRLVILLGTLLVAMLMIAPLVLMIQNA